MKGSASQAFGSWRRQVRHLGLQGGDLLLEALDARDLDVVGRAAAVIDIGERIDLLFEQAHPHDANRSDRGAETQGRVMTFLRTAHQQGADAIAMLVDLARAPNPGLVPGLNLRSG